MGHDELLIHSLKTAFVWERRHSSVGYDPSTDSWTVTSTVNAPDARTSHTTVWTGSEMVVWGGIDQNFIELNSGGRFNPSTEKKCVTRHHNG
jgi:hypothetical protein